MPGAAARRRCLLGVVLARRRVRRRRPDARVDPARRHRLAHPRRRRLARAEPDPGAGGHLPAHPDRRPGHRRSTCRPSRRRSCRSRRPPPRSCSRSAPATAWSARSRTSPTTRRPPTPCRSWPRTRASTSRRSWPWAPTSSSPTANGLTPQTAIDQLRRANIPVLAIYATDVARRPRRHRARRRRGGRRTGRARPDRVDAGRPRPGRRRDPGPGHAADVLRDRRDEGDLRAAEGLVHRGHDQARRRVADHGRRRRAGHPAREARGGRPGGDRPRRRRLRDDPRHRRPSAPAGGR